MATKLELTAGTWYELGSSAIIFDIGTKDVIELTNAASLPTGDQAALVMRPPQIQVIPAPVSGNWYARCAAVDSYITYAAVN